jgi:DNA-binding response OmpR family regulator
MNLPMELPHNTPESAARVLVVDDDEPIRILLQAIFLRHNVALDLAGDGDTALGHLRRSRYDAVILDLMLPGQNGFELLREMKSRDPRLLERTIVLTAVSDLTLRDFADGRLVRRVMRKPFDLDELVGEVLSCAPAIIGRTADLPAEQRVH